MWQRWKSRRAARACSYLGTQVTHGLTGSLGAQVHSALSIKKTKNQFVKTVLENYVGKPKTP